MNNDVVVGNPQEIVEVTYDPNEGELTPTTATFDGSALILPKPVKDGYIFDGWYTELVDGTKIGINGDKYMPTNNITLYAHWSLAPIENPQTGDNIIWFMIIGILSILGMKLLLNKRYN